MNNDKKRLYVLTAIYFAGLLLVCFVSNKTLQIHFLAVFSIISAVCINYLIKKRSIYSLFKKQVALILIALAICMIAIYFITGIKFGYYKVKVSYSSFWLYIIPIVAIIIGTEISRSIFLAQKNKLISIIVFFICVTIDVLILAKVKVFSNFQNFMDTVGLVIFPCLASNFLYHYVSKKYGAIAVVPYKIILFIYPYIFAVIPKLSDALLSFSKIVLPIIIFLIIKSVYTTRKMVKAKTNKGLTIAITSIVGLIAVAFIMLISCQFQYRMIVIATPSMTGTINKGDAVIFEAYDEHILNIGDVIVFNKENALIVHRIVDVTNINGEVKYYTKGDANNNLDSGYVSKGQVVGIIKLKVKFIGYPSLWIRSLFT